MLKTFEKWLVLTNKAGVALMIATMFCLVFSQVLARYLFSVSFAWIDEVVGFMMIWLTYLGAGLALREGRLVGFDLLQKKLPATLGKAMRYLIGVIIFLFMLALIYWGYRFALFGLHKETNVLQISRAIPYSGVAVGSLFFTLHLAIFLTRFVREEWDGEEDAALDNLTDELMEE